MFNFEKSAGSAVQKMKKRIWFIINPISGVRRKDDIPALIRRFLDHDTYTFEIQYTKHKGHAIELAQNAVQLGIDIVCAVGGDGSVHEVGTALIGTKTALAILPAGSGNGLARTLGISMNVEEAIKQIAQGLRTKIDHGTVNGIPFFCTSGIGFDAHIGNLFATSTKRGLQSYVKITITQLFKYRAKEYTLSFNDQSIKRKAFLITVANAGQYGNDFYIAPQANMQDGLFHVVVLKPFSVFHLPGLLTKILMRKANLSSRIETYITNKIVITREANDTIHFDGDPAIEGKEVIFENVPNSLYVIVGEKFKAS
jgi:YegS/Rv2252/BmrU family lipid kinase